MGMWNNNTVSMITSKNSLKKDKPDNARYQPLLQKENCCCGQFTVKVVRFQLQTHIDDSCLLPYLASCCPEDFPSWPILQHPHSTCFRVWRWIASASAQKQHLQTRDLTYCITHSGLKGQWERWLLLTLWHFPWPARMYFASPNGIPRRKVHTTSVQQ